MVLDNLKLIHERDVQDALGMAGRQLQQIEYELTHNGTFPAGTITNIVCAGGGSFAQAALLAKSWLNVPKVVTLIEDYDLPAYVDSQTLCIAGSYSGNTPETLSAVRQAGLSGAQIVVITTGGELAELAKTNSYSSVILPDRSGLQPRQSCLMMLKALLIVLQQVGLVGPKPHDELVASSDFLQTAIAEWLPTVPASRNPAKQLALEVIGKSAVIAAGPKLWPAACRWKTAFNENAKHVAWTSKLPEATHAELIGWSQQPVDKPYAVIELRSELERSEIRQAFTISERLLSGRRPSPLVVRAHGSTLLEQLLWLVVYGDFVTIYVALLNGLNPTPITLTETFKHHMEVEKETSHESR